MAEPLRRRVRAQLLNGLTHAAGFVPSPLLRGGLGCAAHLARFSSIERTTLANLELALGSETTEAERRKIARGVREHSARLLREWIQLRRCAPKNGADPKLPGPHTEWIDERVKLDDSYSILQREHAKGRGVLVSTGHLGNWELLAARLHREGYPGVVVGRKRARDSTADWLIQMREAYGVTTMPQDCAPRDLLRVLQRGEVIGMLSDLEVRRLDGEFLPFFGVPALTMTAPAAIARTRRIPLVPARCVLRGDHYLLSFEEPLEADPSLDRKAQTTDLLTRLNAVFEGWIRETPEQWAWHQRRWHTRPGEWEAQPLVSWQARYGKGN